MKGKGIASRLRGPFDDVRRMAYSFGNATITSFGFNPMAATTLCVWTQYVRLPVVSFSTATPSSMAWMGTEEDKGDPPVALLDFNEKLEPEQYSP